MMETFFSSSEKEAMGTVLLKLVWPNTTDSLVTDSLPSGHRRERGKRHLIRKMFCSLETYKSQLVNQSEISIPTLCARLIQKVPWSGA